MLLAYKKLFFFKKNSGLKNIYNLYYDSFKDKILLLRMYRLIVTVIRNDPQNAFLVVYLISYFIFYLFLYLFIYPFQTAKMTSKYFSR